MSTPFAPRSTPPAGRAWWSGAAVLATLLAVAIVADPLLAVLGVGAMALALVWRYSVSRPPRLFLGALGTLLIGYAFFGRTFAYLGAPPLFIGELVLVLGLVSVAATGRLGVLRRSPVVWLLAAFAAWGAACTVPYIPRYRWDSLRDAVLWGYGAFLPLVAATLLHTRAWPRVVRGYRAVIPWFLAWAPVAVVVGRYMPWVPPHLAGTGVPLIGLKPGDAAVHLAGAAAFLMLGLHRADRSPRATALRVPEPVLWILFLIGFTVSSSVNRGGMLSVLIALAVLSPWVPVHRWWKPAAIAVSIACTLVLLDVDLDFGGNRGISVEQIRENLKSLTGDSSLETTKEWRLSWWTEIVDYTLFGEHFWDGKGYGVSLADSDGFQTPEGDLRSPHNGHMNILARSGVPGAVLWLALLATFAGSLLRGVGRAHGFQARMRLWVLSYWTAFVVNTAFDVFIEGPQAGIWFWSLMGFGVALLEGPAADRRARARAVPAAGKVATPFR